MKKAILSAQKFLEKFDLPAIVFGLLAMGITGVALLGFSWILVRIFDPDFLRHPHRMQPSVFGWFVMTAMMIACALASGFAIARKAKQAPVFNAMFIPAVGIAQKIFLTAMNDGHGKKLDTESFPLWLSAVHIVALILFSYLGVKLAARLRRKPPGA